MPMQNEYRSEAFNLKEFLLQVLSYKYLYIICFILCILIAFLVNKLSTVVYEVNSIIGPVEDNRSSILESNELFSSVGAFSQSRNLENDINSLNSFSLVLTTVKELNLEVGYYREQSKIFGQTRQMYNNSPFTVIIDKSHIQPINIKFVIDIIDENSYRLTTSEDEVTLYNYVDNLITSNFNTLKIDTICRFSETVSNNKFKFSIALNKDRWSNNTSEDGRTYFEFYHLDQLAKQFLGRLTVEPVSIKSSLINVRFRGENINLTIDFLNRYLETYLDENLSKKNRIALNTINFIESQISEISDSLVLSESKLRDYRSAYQVTDLSYQGQQALQQMTQIENEQSTLQVQERYYNYVLEYLSTHQDMAGLAPPSSANVVDPILNSLILDLLSFNAERSAILSNNAEKNLFLGQLENKIRLQIQTITENVKNNLNTLNLSQNELNYRAEKISREISKLPRTELNMVSMQRKFNLSDAIYTFLLQKRSEAAIAMASNFPDYEILEPARYITRTVLSPKKMMNWMMGIFIGLMIPTIFIILKNFFNEKITSLNEIERMLKRSVLSIIYTNNYKTEAIVRDSPGSAVAESFRNLRTSLFLRFRSEPLKVILVTSTQPQDGKSFISFNLAASIASVGHKSIILDGDLRRPTIHEKFRINNTKGLSNFMADHTPKEDIILRTGIENLHFLPAGPVLPNSAEMIEAGVLDELMEFLKKKYDHIIIDTTPAGLVADATMMMKYASVILLVCRNNHTKKDLLKDVLNMFSTNNIRNFDVIFNDLNIKESRYGKYNAYYKK